MGRGRGSPGSTSLGEGVRWEGAHQAVLHLEGGEMGRGRGSPGSTSLGEGGDGKGERLTRQYFTWRLTNNCLA